jgi:ADP-ribose pyrophosphatase YjhB (NUDIX family)
MAEAVVRETREETGLDISCEDVIDYAELIGDGGHYVVVNFGAVVLGGHLEPGDDAEEVAWLALDSLACYDVVESVMDFLDQHGYVELA